MPRIARNSSSSHNELVMVRQTMVMLIREAFHNKNKPKGLKVAKEDQRLIGSMVNGLND